MKTQVVKDLMVPLSEYATVPLTASLQDAVAALHASQESSEGRKYLHRAILVLDDGGNVVGKINLLAILRSLEPKYDTMLSSDNSLHMGFTPEFQKAMLGHLRLWEDPMERICEKAANLKVDGFMTKPTEGEIIDSQATMDEAIHLLVLGNQQSLLVTEGGTVVGILRLTDTFEFVADAISACKL